MGALLVEGGARMRMRVLEVLATLRRAGAERMVVSLAAGLDPSRFEPAVVSLYDAFPGGFEAILEAARVPVRHLGKRRGLDLRMFPRLFAFIGEFRPAIVHTHSYVLRYVLPVARGARIVHTVHNLAHKEVDAAGRALHRLAFRSGVKPVAVSGEVARSFHQTYGFRPAAIVPNGVDLETFRTPPETRARWRGEHGFGANELLFVSVARLEPQKNPLGLIEAFAKVGQGRLLLAGDGSLRARAQEHAAECGVSERVRFLGVRADIPEMLAAADVFVLASHYEGNPVAVMEAMAAGLPVVTTAVGGTPEVVGEAGTLVPPGDTAKLTKEMAALANDAERRARMGEAARGASQRFSVTGMVVSYSHLFEVWAGKAA
jgi:glycosyltransferase involved in cell wall biosynthesis